MDKINFKRPEVLAGRTPRFQMGCSRLYLTINEELGRPVEVFARIGKSGGCQGALLQGLGRVISIALQQGVDPRVLADTLEGISCQEGQAGDPETRLNSCLDAMAHELRKSNEDRCA